MTKTPEQLLKEWESGDSTGLRPERAQTLRDDIKQATGQTLPRRLPGIEAYLNNQHLKATITRELRKAVDDDDA